MKGYIVAPRKPEGCAIIFLDLAKPTKVQSMDKGLPISYKHFFQKLVEAIPWPMLVIDTDLRIVHGNQQAQALFELGDFPPLTEQRLDQLLDDAAILQLI